LFVYAPSIVRRVGAVKVAPELMEREEVVALTLAVTDPEIFKLYRALPSVNVPERVLLAPDISTVPLFAFKVPLFMKSPATPKVEVGAIRTAPELTVKLEVEAEDVKVWNPDSITTSPKAEAPVNSPE
jgi:hypothetical protein